MFFEAYEEYPAFKEKVRAFYGQLKVILVKQLINENVKNPIQEATELITKYEGLISWISVFPEEKIQ